MENVILCNLFYTSSHVYLHTLTLGVIFGVDSFIRSKESMGKSLLLCVAGATVNKT